MTVAVAIDDPSYDIGRISRRVRYVDNDVNLDSSGLPVPDAADVDFAPLPTEEPGAP